MVSSVLTELPGDTAGEPRRVPRVLVVPQTLPASLRALLDASAALIRRSSSGRVALARAAGVVPADGLPEIMRERLPAALTHAYEATTEPLAAKHLKKAVRGVTLDPEPLAVGPTAQVHAGDVDGEPVAVKVARPGLAATVRNDLALLDALAAPVGAVFRALDVGGVLREIREALQDELDLEHEGAMQRQARRALRGLAGVTVPAVHSELTSEGVLVTDRLDGPTLAEAGPEDPGEVARALVAAHVTAWREGGLILTDARPSHVVLLADGGVGLLGTGVSRPGDRDRAVAFGDAFAALGADDADTFVEAVADRLALLPAADAHGAHVLLRDVLGPLADGPARLDGPALAEVGERALDRIGDLVALGARATPQPADLAAARMVGQLAATLSVLGATEDWPLLASARLAG
jgi:predicted unusual protein kinase regulating ubiquinone biosynthesis (AarF/ABC1/UbiB family)